MNLLAEYNRNVLCGGMSKIENLVEALGRKNLIRELDLKRPTSISNAIAAGEFPARWKPVISKLCVVHGVDITQDELEGLCSFIPVKTALSQASEAVSQ